MQRLQELLSPAPSVVHERRRATSGGPPLGHSDEAWALVEELAAAGTMNAHHCTAMMQAAIGPAQAGRIARLATQAKLDWEPPVVRALFGAWCRCHYYEFALAVLEEAVERKVLKPVDLPLLLTKPLAVLAKQGAVHAGNQQGSRVQAWQLFRVIQDTPFVDRFHYNTMLQLTSVPFDVDIAAGAAPVEGLVSEVELLAEMEQAGIAMDVVTFNTRLQRRLALVQTARHPSVGPTDNSISDAIDNVVHEMKHTGVGPNMVTYLLLHQSYLAATIPDAAAAAEVLIEARRVLPREVHLQPSQSPYTRSAVAAYQ